MRPIALAFALSTLALAALDAQAPSRAVRRDLPLGPSIRRAYAAGTRDSTGRPGSRYWQQRVDYAINASIDVDAGTLRGSEMITLHNTSPDTLRRVVLRLYQNYFKPDESRNDYVTDNTEGTVVERLSVGGTTIDLASAAYRVNGTVAVITLPAPAAPGADVKIDAAWHFAVPRVDTLERGERMGRFGTFLYQVAQWYPQVAMYDDLRGWDTDQYLGIGEFYNQFGSFDVNLTLPAGWLVGATGTLQNPEQVWSRTVRDRLALAMRVDTTVHVVSSAERGAGVTAGAASLTWHFTAPMVNDFAFAASKNYVYDATHANIDGKGAIPVNLFYLPQHTDYAKNNTAQIGRFALEQHSRFLFPYEFAQGTIADGPETGMEYPMIIFNGPNFGVTVHEFGHEWFPMMVGSNETRYGWQDEGFNEFIDAAAAEVSTKKPFDWTAQRAGYLRVAGSELEAPMMWPTDFVGPNAGMTTYTKAPMVLHALGAVVGDSAVHRAFAAYAVAWKFKHPSPWDFFTAMNRELGQNLDWFWNAWFFTSGTLDQSVQSVSVAGGTATIVVADVGDVPMPVVLRLDYTDGTTETVKLAADGWFAGTRALTVRRALGGKTLKLVTVNGDGRLPDVNPTNDTWPGSKR